MSYLNTIEGPATGNRPLMARTGEEATTPRERMHSVAAIALLVLAIVAGGVSWMLQGTALWVLLGIAVALLVAGIYLAARANAPREDGPT